MREFIDESELQNFEGWMNYQRLDLATLTSDDRAFWEKTFRDVQEAASRRPAVGFMDMKPLVPDEYRYAVAVEDGTDLWLTLWVRRSPRGDFYVMVPRQTERLPRSRSEWNSHASYHASGEFHFKSYDHKHSVRQLQPPTGEFKGVVGLGQYSGHGPRSVGAICDPDKFSGVVRVPTGVLGPTGGGVTVELVEPGCAPLEPPWQTVVVQETFSHFAPNLVITVGCDHLIGVTAGI